MTPISPGTLLAGRFRLEDLLEETGGARFWRATDLTLMRDVAVHVLDANDPRSQAMLGAARASATITGPHLLRVLDAAVEDGVAYVVNEWGNGVSLDRMLLEGPLQPRQAAWMVREVAEAIADAHGLGIAHGRLVPENVMVNENGSVKLIGFVVDGVLHGRHDSDLTEQQADVRNLAALLYAALVARWPGVSGSTLARAPLDHGRVLRARQVRAGVPTSLDRLCDTVLNGDPGFPIESAHEIKAALSDFLGDVGEGRPLGRHASPEVSDATEQIVLRPQDPEATHTSMPLFVDDDVTQVNPLQPSSKTPYVGMGGGVMPQAWGPDAGRQQAPEVSEEWHDEPPGTSWLRLAGLVAAALALVVAVVFAFNLGRGTSGDPDDTESPDTSAPAATELTLVSVEDFDPFQDGGAPEENPDQVPLAYDGDPSTAWITSTYQDGPDITVYKPGVGLLVDLGAEEPVTEVALQLQGSPTTVTLFAAPPGSGVPSSIDGLDQVATADQAGTAAILTPDDTVTTRYLVVWLTVLPRVSDGYRGAVAEIVVRS